MTQIELVENVIRRTLRRLSEANGEYEIDKLSGHLRQLEGMLEWLREQQNK